MANLYHAHCTAHDEHNLKRISDLREMHHGIRNNSSHEEAPCNRGWKDSYSYSYCCFFNSSKE
eukprot:scaffold34265_cov73-Skeletonema_marinoi.AAC.1